MQIGDTITVPYEESKRRRKEGWKVRNDIVVMMYVGLPDSSVPSNYEAAATRRTRKRGWSAADHEFVARKLAEASA